MTWTKSEIQQARKLSLPSILRQKGFVIHELAGENYRVDPYPDLFVKDSYWICKSRQLHGNTIDFFVKIQNLSFSETMQLLHPK